MSEQEKKSCESAVSSPIAMVDHKQPYRPNELEEVSEVHHKCPKPPLVPSVNEELKHVRDKTTLSDNAKVKKRIEELNNSTENIQQSFAKKVTSSVERLDHSPESITLAPIEVDRKKGTNTSLPQPIPTDVSSTKTEIVKENKTNKMADQESDASNEEIAKLQTSEIANKSFEWSDDEEAGGLPRTDSRASRVSRMCTLSSTLKQRELSRDDTKYKKDIPPKESVAKHTLDQRASIAPCFRALGPHEGPSGISICLPKKSLKCVDQPSGINITISRKYIPNTPKIVSDDDGVAVQSVDEKAEKVKSDTAFGNFVDNLKERFSNIQTKMKSIFQA